VTRLVRLITYNWPLKLAAIALATLLYAGLVVSQSQFEFTSPIQIRTINQPTTAVLLGNLPPVTRVRYVVSGDVGSGPTADSFRATIDLAPVNPQAGSTYVAIDVVSLDRRFLVVDWEPRGINVQLDPKVTKDVAVVVKTGDLPTNLDVREPVVDPETVTVSGPASVVSLVVAARADVTIDPSGLLVDRDVPLIPVDIVGNILRPITVTPASAHVKIAVFTNARSKTLSVHPNVTGTPPSGYVVDTVVVDPAAVTVEANGDQLATLTRVDTKEIPIGAVTGTLETDVGFALPAGVLPVGIDKVHVTVTIKPETGTKPFMAALVMTGRQPGLEYTLSASQIQVAIGGPLADLDRLDPAAFIVNLDVGGLGPGVHELVPAPNLQAGLRLLTMDPAKVTVTVRTIASPEPSSSPSVP
jgi:YbbR domain-containing protein